MTLLLVCCLAGGTVGAAAAETIWFTADLHYGDETAGKEEVLRSLLDMAREGDALLLLGDITNNGKPLEVAGLQKTLAVAAEQGCSVYVLPGNHDLSTLSAKEFSESFNAFGWEQAYTVEPISRSYGVHLGEGLELAMVNTAVQGEAGGMVSSETLAWLKTVLAQAEEQGSRVLVCGHHPLLAHSVNDDRRSDLTSGRREMVELLAGSALPLFLAGHRHIGHWAMQDGLSEILAAKTDLWPLRVGRLTVNADEADFQLVPLAEEDSPLMQNALQEMETKALQMGEGALTSTSYAGNREMIGYFAGVYRAYLGGSLYREREKYLQDPAYLLWQSDEITSIFKPWLAFLLSEMKEDYTRLHLPLQANETAEK